MKYELKVRPANIPAHLDIERDIRRQVNGIMTFTIRVNAGNIVDYVKIEYVNTKRKYLVSGSIIEELSVSRPH